MTKPSWSILLIGDAPEDRDVYQRYLQHDPAADYRFWEAEPGTQALALCQTLQPDCIILDYRLPDLTGLGYLARLQAQGETPGIPVIWLIGAGSEAVAIEAMKQGAQDCLVREYLTPEILHQAVHQAVEKVTLLRILQAHRQQIQEREEQFRLALEAAQIRVWDLDVRTRTMLWSENLGPGFRPMPGASSNTYDAFLALVHPEDRDYVTHTIAHVLEEGVGYEIEYRLIQPNGNIGWRLATGQVVRDAAGQALRLVGIDRDITIRKQAEQALAQAHTEFQQRLDAHTAALRRELAERQRAEEECRRLEHEAQQAAHFARLGRLAADVSHEIRNPLAAVFLHVDLLAEALQQPTPDSQEEVTQALTEIKTQLVRLDDLVQNYLSLVRVTRIQMTSQDLGTAVHAWTTEMQGPARARGVRLHLEGITGLGQVAFHHSSLRRTVLNLMQNALEAMPQGGTMTLVGQTTATHVSLQVQDTGMGIPSEQLAGIFKELYTTKPGGTGLGLYIVQEIVAAHAGQITVQSEEGGGTTFTITLPRTLGEATS